MSAHAREPGAGPEEAVQLVQAASARALAYAAFRASRHPRLAGSGTVRLQ